MIASKKEHKMQLLSIDVHSYHTHALDWRTPLQVNRVTGVFNNKIATKQITKFAVLLTPVHSIVRR